MFAETKQFDRLTHQPPRINSNGFNLLPKARDCTNILTHQNNNVPKSWTDTPLVNSRSELLEKRRQSNIPDPSYDLDGDGHVAAHDFVIAKIFDKDKDGKLNAQERKEADEAVKNVRFSS